MTDSIPLIVIVHLLAVTVTMQIVLLLRKVVVDLNPLYDVYQSVEGVS